MTDGPVPRILAAQGDDGHWEGRGRAAPDIARRTAQ
jgi:hypothetical protein